MSAISDKLKSTIQKVLDMPKQELQKKVELIITATRAGAEDGGKTEKILNQIEQAQAKINQVENIIQTVNAVITSLEDARKAAEATEKASTISASLNPAAAAVAVAQKFVIEKVKQETEEAKDALNVAPKLIENFKNFVNETKVKLEKVKKQADRKKALREQRKRKLNS